MEGVLLLYEFLAGIFLTVVAWVQKIGFKKRLSKGLGRKVSDQELLSISTWMKISNEKKCESSQEPALQKGLPSHPPSRSGF